MPATDPPAAVADAHEQYGRLFVPLKTPHYRAFVGGGKTWELRGVGDRFNQETVFEGRPVELRRGYSTDDVLWGIIETVEQSRTLEELTTTVPADDIAPGADYEQFVDTVERLLGGYDAYIAFEVDLVEGGRRD